MIGGLGWIDAGCPDEVERDDCLLGELVPQLEGPVAVGRAEATDEVVLERLDGPSGRIDAVVCRFDKLPFAVLLLEEGFLLALSIDCLSRWMWACVLYF